jgi:Carboxypeptidase regulatory-like domain
MSTRQFAIAVYLSAAVSAVMAQSDRGAITGTVSDPAGAVVAGAPVQIKNVETGAVYQAGSSGTGNYTLAQLPAGQYELSVGQHEFLAKNAKSAKITLHSWRALRECLGA